MNVQPILQPIRHEAYGVESAFVLHWIKHLDNNNFYKFHELQSLWLRMGFAMILHQRLIINFKLFSSYKMASELCIIVTLKWDDYKSKSWIETNASNPILPFSPNLQGTQKMAFKAFMWEWKVVSTLTMFLVWNWG
jgi:hypothetical protein